MRKIGTPVFANGWWLVPIADSEPLATGRPHDLSEPLRKSGVASATTPGHVFAEIIVALLPLTFPRKASADLHIEAGLEMLAAQVAMRDGKRHEINHRLVVREQNGRLVASFAEPAPLSGTCHEICCAVQERLAMAHNERHAKDSADFLRSNWNIDELLGELEEYERVDDEVDLLAFRIASASSARTMYIYLYGNDPGLIRFDLEDPTAKGAEWDAAVGRGSARTTERLLAIARAWLDDERMIPEGGGGPR